MKSQLRVFALLAAGLAFAPGLALCAQGRGPGGPPGQRGPGGPGGPGGPYGPNGPGNGQPPSSGTTPTAVGAGPANRNALQFGPPGRWWDDRTVVASVGISASQQKRMDALFDANKPAILASYKALTGEQAKLATLNKSAQPNQAAVFAQIDAVNQARAALQKATAQMLLQIRGAMAPAQVEKLEQIH